MEAIDIEVLTPERVHETLSRHMLTDGMSLVLDLAQSDGVHLKDEITGRSFIDFFGFFASNAIGLNHPKMRGRFGLYETPYRSGAV